MGTLHQIVQHGCRNRGVSPDGGVLTSKQTIDCIPNGLMATSSELPAPWALTQETALSGKGVSRRGRQASGMDRETFNAIRLVEARKRAGLSQRDLARKAGVAQSVIAELERGKHPPSVSSLSKLATALGVNPTQLLGN